MENSTKKTLLIVLAIVVLVIGAMILLRDTEQASPYQGGALEAFAMCIQESGAKFYGAFWCSHCQDQKKDFGDAVNVLPYVECSTIDGRGQTEVCREAEITGYPTWVFGDGSRGSGRLSFDVLAERTGCTAPAQNESE